MKEVILEAQSRTIGSKGAIANIRKEGKVPAVFYGKDIESENISVDSKEFMTIIAANGVNAIITLNMPSGKKTAIVKSVQKDILTQDLIHIDFHAVSMKEKVEVEVPIHIDGVADGVKNFGGLMEFILREVSVECLPNDIPQKISVDVSPLGIGDSITVADLPKIEGVEYLQDPETLIINVVAVTVEEETAAEEGAAATEPEVIAKGKKEEEPAAEEKK